MDFEKTTKKRIIIGFIYGVVLFQVIIPAIRPSVYKLFANRQNLQQEDIRVLWFLLFFILLSLLVVLIDFYSSRKKKGLKNLLPYFSEDFVNKELENVIPHHILLEAPSDFDEPSKAIESGTTRFHAIKYFKNKIIGKPNNKYVMLFAGAGMGKTNFLINLYMALIKDGSYNYKVRLIPLNNLKGIKEVYELPIDEKRETVLLLDALDEDKKAIENCNSRLSELCELLWDFKNIIISCRTQFFPSENNQPKTILLPNPEGGTYSFLNIYVSPFTYDECKKYINKKFNVLKGGYKYKKNRALSILNNNKLIMARPMIISNIGKLVSSNQFYQTKYDVYKEIVNQWIKRETEKQVISEPQKVNFSKNLMQFSQEIAEYMYVNSTNTVSSSDAETIAKNNEIDINKLEFESKSLLNRDSLGIWKFSHKSILEYFIANRELMKIGVDKDLINKSFDFAYDMLVEYKIFDFFHQPSIGRVDYIWFTYKIDHAVWIILDYKKALQLTEHIEGLKIASTSNISFNLKGIEVFTNLQKLEVSGKIKLENTNELNKLSYFQELSFRDKPNDLNRYSDEIIERITYEYE